MAADGPGPAAGPAGLRVVRLPGLPSLPGIPGLPGRGSDAISPTAHYTGRVWGAHGLSHPALGTLEGAVLHVAVRPLEVASALVGGPSLDGLLLARHRAIDARLSGAIDAGRIGQVVELASGLSPRGLRFAGRVDYVEADLPAMAARKRRALERAGATHRVADVDVFAPGGLEALLGTLDPSRGVAVVTEGLINYFALPDVLALWERLAGALRAFPSGLYLSDLFLEDSRGGVLGRLGYVGISVFVRGAVHPHFTSELEADTALRRAGFQVATVAPAGERRGAELVRIVEAWV